jgi:hypothetical protein
MANCLLAAQRMPNQSHPRTMTDSVIFQRSGNSRIARIIGMRTELLAHRENGSNRPLNRPDRVISGAGRCSNSPHTRQFRASLRKISDVEDSLAEGTVYGEPLSTVVDTHAVVDEAACADEQYNRTMLLNASLNRGVTFQRK